MNNTDNQDSNYLEVNFFMTNCRSMMNKLDIIECEIFACKKYDIIILTETWARPFFDDKLFEKPDYTLFRDDRVTGRGGGIMIYVNNSLQPSVITLPRFKSTVNAVACSFHKKGLILGVYRPPNNTQQNLKLDLEDICNCIRVIERQCVVDKLIFIAGDLNLPNLIWEQKQMQRNPPIFYELLATLSINNLQQIVNFPTRTSSILDVLFASRNIAKYTVHDHPNLGDSDHSSIVYKCFIPDSTCPVKYGERTGSSTINLNKVDWYRFSLLMEYDYPQFFLMQGSSKTDINNLVQYYTDCVLNNLAKSTLDISVTVIANSSKCKHSKMRMIVPWCNYTCIAAINKKRWLYNRVKRFNNADERMEYKRHSNYCKFVIRKAKTDYEDKVANSLCTVKNSQSFWKYLKRRLNKKRSNQLAICDQSVDANCSTLISDPVQVAKLFNDFFATVFCTNNDQLSSAAIQNIVAYYSGHMQNEPSPITGREIIDAISKLKSSYTKDNDSLSNMFYRLSGHVTVKFLSRIFNLMFYSGIFPDIWKTARIIPLFKKGNVNIVSNYRPISILSCTSKIFEIIIKNRMLDYLEEHNLIVNEQHGFRKGASTTSNLLLFTHTIANAFMDNNEVHAVFIDYLKAFDKVQHNFLLQKMACLGINIMYINMICDYLSNRQQIVCIDGKFSNTISCKSGVPQGSVLGPFLFSIFINDVVHSVKHSNILLFADDLKLFKVISKENRLSDINKFQQDLNEIYNWSVTMCLPINVSKSNWLIFTNNHKKATSANTNITYMCNSESLSQVDNVKDLGVLFDKRISFNEHINYSVLKAQKISAVINKLFSFSKVDTKVRMFNTFIRPQLEYASQVWSPSKKSLINKIEKLQRNYTRKLEPSLKLDYEQRLNRINALSLSMRRDYLDMCYLYKIWYSECKLINLDSLLLNKGSSTRNYMNITPKYNANSTVYKEFSRRAIIIWNSLPVNIRKLPTLTAFKVKMKKWFMTREFKQE